MKNTLDTAINNMPVKGFLDLKQFAIPTGDDLVQAILDLKKEKIPHPDPMPLDEALKIVGNADHQHLAQALAKGEVPAGLTET